MSNQTITSGQSIAVPATGVRTACAIAFVFGAGLVFMVGFAHVDVLHNAAHDTRHSLAFPCH